MNFLPTYPSQRRAVDAVDRGHISKERTRVEESKLEAVRTHLRDEFAGAVIDEMYDSTVEAQTFRICIGKDTLLLKVDRNFIDDNNAKQVLAYLKQWMVTNLLRENKDLEIFVGNKGPQTFERFK